MEVHTIHFNTIDSTNTWAKNHAKELNPKQLTCITSDVQTVGRGRYTRKWISVKGNLYMTLFFCLHPHDPALPNLAQLLAYAAAQILLAENLSVSIKWPNDLLIDGKKICGSMVETVPLDGHLGIILGVGMNVNTSIETDQPTISLHELTGHRYDLKLLRDQLISHFQKALQLGFPALHKYFENLLAYRGEPIICYVNDEPIQGTLIGLTENGQLRIKSVDGTIRTIYSGNIQNLRHI